ncbi:uncharacterized protein [Manis javanica]|uniref:uncharacterized protein isoform X2 n=1 Tax=Manis javanica TaxID=9974 RepID=UPI00187944FB|nr:interleukin-1 family member 10 isoform X1 [Manis javanica]
MPWRNQSEVPGARDLQGERRSELEDQLQRLADHRVTSSPAESEPSAQEALLSEPPVRTISPDCKNVLPPHGKILHSQGCRSEGPIRERWPAPGGRPRGGQLQCRGPGRQSLPGVCGDRRGAFPAAGASRAAISIRRLACSCCLAPQDVNIEDLYKGGEQTTRFTFFQRSWGSAFRLEAAAWPGWFLCGPAEPQQLVRLAKESEPSAHMEFYFEQSL